MKKKRLEMEFTTWQVVDLRYHPKQSEYFPSLHSAAISALAADISTNGLREPLEITSSGVLISGHQRLRAIIELGWTEVAVVVRHDLIGEKEIERRLVECNFNRRHLSLLEQARCYKYLKELSPPAAKRGDSGDLRDQLGKRMGKSGRSLDRLLPLLDLPPEIQRAVDDKKIPIKRATLLAKLPRESLDPIVDAIVHGKNLRMAVLGVLFDHGLVGRAAATAEQLKAQLRSVILQISRLAKEGKRLRPMIRKDQVPKLTFVAGFLLHLCPAGPEPAKNGDDRSTSRKDLKPRSRQRPPN